MTRIQAQNTIDRPAAAAEPGLFVGFWYGLVLGVCLSVPATVYVLLRWVERGVP